MGRVGGWVGCKKGHLQYLINLSYPKFSAGNFCAAAELVIWHRGVFGAEVLHVRFNLVVMGLLLFAGASLKTGWEPEPGLVSEQVTQRPLIPQANSSVTEAVSGSGRPETCSEG